MPPQNRRFRLPAGVRGCAVGWRYKPIKGVLLYNLRLAALELLASQGKANIDHTVERKMEQLDRIIREAAAAIDVIYFQLPVDGGDPVYRERVYCYELYHQMRAVWPQDAQFSLNGEVDKRAHPLWGRIQARIAAPDLLVHTPGHMDGNHCVIEVKPSNARREGIEKDLLTLSQFRDRAGYERAILLFYGSIPQVLEAAIRGAGQLPTIEYWLHPAHHTPAEGFR